MDLNFTNKVALVTAASKGIGFSVAEKLAADGCDLIITSSDLAKLELARRRLVDRYGVRVSAHQMNLADPIQVSRAMDAILESTPSLHILILNGPGPAPMEAQELDSSRLRDSMASTLFSMVDLCYRSLPGMQAAGFGRIVFLASSTAKEPDVGMVLSNVSRSAIIAYAKSLSREVASSGITVNSILTGSVLTDRTRELLQFEAESAGIPVDTFIAEAAAEIPVGYICPPAEFAGAVTFLCSEQASYINGVSLPVDGGFMRGI